MSPSRSPDVARMIAPFQSPSAPAIRRRPHHRSMVPTGRPCFLPCPLSDQRRHTGLSRYSQDATRRKKEDSAPPGRDCSWFSPSSPPLGVGPGKRLRLSERLLREAHLTAHPGGSENPQAACDIGRSLVRPTLAFLLDNHSSNHPRTVCAGICSPDEIATISAISLRPCAAVSSLRRAFMAVFSRRRQNSRAFRRSPVLVDFFNRRPSAERRNTRKRRLGALENARHESESML